jgi:hypothetical protein
VRHPPPFREQALCHEPAGSNDSLQPIADLGRAANGTNDLTRDPAPPNQVAACRLGHRNLATTEKYYNQALSIEAVRQYQKLVIGIRSGTIENRRHQEDHA